MAKIDRFASRRRGGPSFISTVPSLLRVPDFGSAIGQAVTRWIDQERAEAETSRRRADQVEYARRASEFELEMGTRLDEATSNYDGSAPGFQDEQLQAWDHSLAEMLSDAPERVRPQLEARLRGSARATFGLAAMRAERASSDAYALRSIGATVEAQANAIQSAPAGFRGALVGLPDLAEALPASARQAFLDEAEGQLSGAYVAGRLREDPAGLIEELNGGSLDDVIDPSTKNSYLNSAQTELDRRAREARIAANQAAAVERRAIDRALDDAEDAAENGLRPEVGFADLRIRAEALGGEDGAVLAMRAAEGQELEAFSHEFARMSLVDAEAAVRAERARVSGSATGFEARRLEHAESMFSNMQSRLRDDPVQYAAGLGFDVGTIDVASADTIGASLARRRDRAVGVATHYGVEVQYLSETERTNIAAGIRDGRLNRLDVAGAIAGTMDADARVVLSEIAPDEPMLAHMGGLLTGRATRAAADLDEGLRLRDQDGFASRLPPVRRRQERAASEFGAMADRLPRTTAQIMAAADLIYEARAHRNGWAADDFRAEQYSRALIEASGGSYVGNVQFGGLINYRPRNRGERVQDFGHYGTGLFTTPDTAGTHVLVGPSWLRADRFDDVINMIADQELGGPRTFMMDASGEEIPASMLHRARLQSIGDDQYLVSFGDGTRVALNSGGTPFVLNLSSWRRDIEAQKPNWVR